MNEQFRITGGYSWSPAFQYHAGTQGILNAYGYAINPNKFVEKKTHGRFFNRPWALRVQLPLLNASKPYPSAK